MEKILVIDIGNSYIKYAYFVDGLIKKFVFNLKSEDKVNLSELKKIDFDLVLISSVVSKLTKIIINKIKSLSKCKIINIKNLKKNLKLNVDVPLEEIGLDLIADLIACKKDYKAPSIIFDIGTVNKVLALDKNKTFVGCSFFPGLETSSKALFNHTDALPKVNLINVKMVLGKNTNQAISSGIINSVVYSINGFIKDYKLLLGKNSKVIITGGGASLIYKSFKNIIYDPLLTVKGIYYIYKEIC